MSTESKSPKSRTTDVSLYDLKIRGKASYDEDIMIPQWVIEDRLGKSVV